MITCRDTTDSNQEDTILFTRKTTSKSEDNLQLVVRNRLLGGKIRRENLQGGVVESDRSSKTSGNLNVEFNTVQALGHKSRVRKIRKLRSDRKKEEKTAEQSQQRPPKGQQRKG